MTVLTQLTNLFDQMGTDDTIEITLKKKHQDLTKELEEVKVSFDITDLSNILASVQATENYQKSLEQNLMLMFDKKESEDEVTLESTPPHFYVKCVEDVRILNSLAKTIGKVKEGEEFKVVLNKNTEQYLAETEGRGSILVGYLDGQGLLHIDKNFRLLPESQQKFNYIYTS